MDYPRLSEISLPALPKIELSCPTFVIRHPSSYLSFRPKGEIYSNTVIPDVGYRESILFPNCHPDPFDFAQDKGSAKDLCPPAKPRWVSGFPSP